MKFITVLLIVLLCMLQYRLWMGNANLLDVRQLEQTRSVQSAENDRLRERNQSLSAEVQDLKSGLEAIEERARSEMGMIKSDETFFQIVNENGLPLASQQDEKP